METHTARTLDEGRDVAEFLDDKTWEHAREFLRAAPADPFADHLRWMEEGGRPVACVQVFLHRYPIGCAEVGMCLPEYPFVPPELRGRFVLLRREPHRGLTGSRALRIMPP